VEWAADWQEALAKLSVERFTAPDSQNNSIGQVCMPSNTLLWGGVVACAIEITKVTR
jgi:hypothetical protein